MEKKLGKDLDAKEYAVSIPYRDAAFNQYVGRSANPITQTYTFLGISAKSQDEAIKIALSKFKESNLNFQYVNPALRVAGSKPPPVEIFESWIVASEKTQSIVFNPGL